MSVRKDIALQDYAVFVMGIPEWWNKSVIKILLHPKEKRTGPKTENILFILLAKSSNIYFKGPRVIMMQFVVYFLWLCFCWNSNWFFNSLSSSMWCYERNGSLKYKPIVYLKCLVAEFARISDVYFKFFFSLSFYRLHSRTQSMLHLI